MRYLNFCPVFFGYDVEKRLDEKAMVNFKIYDVTHWTKIFITHILPNISRSKESQTIKFQLIEYNMRNIFLEKSYTKYGGEASPRPFYEKSKLSVSLDQQSEMLQSLFLVYAQAEAYQKSIWNYSLPE